MIYVEMYGRLGNQFFRYAVARSLQLEFYPNEQLCLNFNQIDRLGMDDPSFYNVLADYNVANYIEYQKRRSVISQKTNFLQKIIGGVYYLGLRKIPTNQMNRQLQYQDKWVGLLNSIGLYWFRNGFYQLSKSLFKNKFISGNFEDPRYFEKYREVLLKELTPKHALLEKNSALQDLINSTNSVCITVRRGDYESNPNIKSLHSVCDNNYFESAIEIMKGKLDNPVFFMFSDDIEWVKENINTGTITYYEDGTDPVWEKLRLMSSCKHFIISNSSFSWWSQWLSTNDEKLVISPKKWYNNDYSSPLISNSWIKI